MNGLLEALNQEQTHLSRLEGAEFLRRLPQFVDRLHDETELGDVLSEMRDEAEKAQKEFSQSETELREEAKTLRQRLVELAPTADDSDAQEPDEFGSRAYSDWRFTLAYFDRLADEDHPVRMPKLPSDSIEEGPLPHLLNVLKGKLFALQYPNGLHAGEAERQRPDLEEVEVGLQDLIERHEHAVRTFSIASRTLPGFALIRLDYFATQINREPAALEIDRDADPDLQFAQALMAIAFSAPERAAQRAVAGEALEDFEEHRLVVTVSDLKQQAELLYSELAARFGQDQRRRERQPSRRFGRWLTAQVASALVQLIVAAVGGFVIGYVVGQVT